MKLYTDYCPDCPHEMRDSLIARHPEDCYKCAPPKTLKDALSSYIENVWARDKCQARIDELVRGMEYHNQLIDCNREKILAEAPKDQLDIYVVGNQAILIDREGDGVVIKFAKLRKV